MTAYSRREAHMCLHRTDLTSGSMGRSPCHSEMQETRKCRVGLGSRVYILHPRYVVTSVVDAFNMQRAALTGGRIFKPAVVAAVGGASTSTAQCRAPVRSFSMYIMFINVVAGL